ncbi:MAG TPA: hypothetical protein VKA68_01595 [bacterium]|nr:hypothetical protein [bacterium]
MEKIKKHIAWMVLLAFSSQLSGAALLFQRSSQTVVAVTNFINTGDNRNTDYLQTEIPQVIAEQINTGGRLQALPPDQAGTSFGDVQGSEPGVSDTQMLSRLGQSLQAQTVLAGSYVSIGSMVKIDIRLLDTESGEPLLEQSHYLLEGQDLSTLAQKLTESVEAAIFGETPATQPPVDAGPAPGEPANQSTQPVSEPAALPSAGTTSTSITSHWWYWALLGAGVAGGVYGVYKLIQSDANTSTVSIDFPLP